MKFRDYVNEGDGFRVNLKGNMVPIGNYIFKYSADDKSQVKFILGSAKARANKYDYKIVKQKGNAVWIDADANFHDSLIAGLQSSYHFNGEVNNERT